jgi:hypothetical protein
LYPRNKSLWALVLYSPSHATQELDRLGKLRNKTAQVMLRSSNRESTYICRQMAPGVTWSRSEERTRFHEIYNAADYKDTLEAFWSHSNSIITRQTYSVSTKSTRVLKNCGAQTN